MLQTLLAGAPVTLKGPSRHTPAPVREAGAGLGAGASADSRSLLAPARLEACPACGPSQPLGGQWP